MTMPHTRRLSAVAALAAVLVGLPLAALPAQAAAPATPEITLAYFASDTYQDVVDSAVATNGRAKVAAYLDQAKGVVPAGFPGLSGLDATQQKAALEATVAAVKQGKALPDSIATKVAAPEQLATSAAAASPPTTLAASGGVTTFSTPSTGINQATVFGSAINDRRSWVFTDRVTRTKCGITCTTEGWIEFRLTTDPGLTGSRTSVSATYWGTGLSHNVTYAGKLYRFSTLIKSTAPTFYASGTGTLWFQDHVSLLDRSFQFSYSITATLTGLGTATAQYATKPGNCYTSASVGPICIFDA